MSDYLSGYADAARDFDRHITEALNLMADGRTPDQDETTVRVLNATRDALRWARTVARSMHTQKALKTALEKKGENEK